MLRNFASAPFTPWFGNPEWHAKGAGNAGHYGEKLDSPRKIRIIVIDDESLIAETLLEILRHEGFEAMAVSSGESALALAQDWDPDIVLSDVIMPGLDGIETGIRMREINPQCKIILFSGQAATIDLLDRARKQGHSFDILAKPIKPEHLVSVIRRVVGPIPS